MNKELIYLVGMPGCGKSTEGKKLAKSLNRQFIDLDIVIEKSEGKSISEMFELHGEPYFREREHEQLLQTFKLKQSVIACGGGTASYKNNMQLINKNGISIYLNAPVGFLFSRIIGSKSARPMYFGLSESEIFKKLEELLVLRGPFFLQAQLEITLPMKSGKLLLDKTLELLQK